MFINRFMVGIPILVEFFLQIVVINSQARGMFINRFMVGIPLLVEFFLQIVVINFYI